MDALVEEATRQFQNCCFSQSRDGLAYEAYLADLGPRAADYLHAESTACLLKRLFGRSYRLVPGKSCFTYYFGGGYLDPHVDDIPGESAISMLTYLVVDSAQPVADRPALDIYSRGTSQPGERRGRILTSPASVVLGYGTDVWHGRAPLGPDETVVMINGSYGVDRDD